MSRRTLFLPTLLLPTILLQTLCPPTAFAWKPARWELRTGYGYQYTNHKRPTNFQIHPVLASLVYPLTDPVGPAWLRGRWTWNPEFWVAAFSHPYERPLVGMTPLQFRYELEPIGRWAPYGVLGAGVLWAAINRGESGSDVNFNLQGGLGLRYLVTTRTSVIVEYRHIHVSNAGLDERNTGLNTHTFLVGVAVNF